MDTVYRERSNGRWEFWTYSEGRRIPLSPQWVARARNVKVIDVR